MKNISESNKQLWNNWAKINSKSEFYDVDRFKAGKTSLKNIELTELGNVQGKSLLHLQCHFGLDTLSWAREGAKVTGVDFSEEAINLQIIAHFLKPGGTFYIIEFHPFTHMFDENWQNLSESYFYDDKPQQVIEHGSYADKSANFSHISYEWPHKLSDVINALHQAGIIIEIFHEFPFSSYNCFPNLVEKNSNEYVLANNKNNIPLMYSIKAIYKS